MIPAHRATLPRTGMPTPLRGECGGMRSFEVVRARIKPDSKELADLATGMGPARGLGRREVGTPLADRVQSIDAGRPPPVRLDRVADDP